MTGEAIVQDGNGNLWKHHNDVGYVRLVSALWTPEEALPTLADLERRVGPVRPWAQPLNEGATRWAVERIIDSYTLCMVGTNTEPYIQACVDDVLAEVLGWPVRYKPAESVAEAVTPDVR